MKIVDSIMNKIYKPKGNLLIMNGRFKGKRDPRFTYDKNERLLDLSYIEKPAREGVKKLYSKNIYTYYSEGGGKYHGYPDYLFVLSRLFNENAEIARKSGLILDAVEYNRSNKSEIINLTHPENLDVGYYLLGINRKGMEDNESSKKFSSLVDMLEMQEDDLAGRGEGVFKKERPEIKQLSSILDKV